MSRLTLVGVAAGCSTLLVACSPVWGQARERDRNAFCALRDPFRQINATYPRSTFRSIVRTIGPDARRAVSERLPFSLGFDELGQHTLYLVQREDRPVGLVHVRPEKDPTSRQRMEILWALDPDLRVRDFRFQRCYSRNRTSLETDAFRAQLRGKGFEELRRMLSKDGVRVDGARVRIARADEELAAAVLRCALKTIVVSKVVWAPDLARAERLRLLGQARRAFPEGRSVQRFATAYTAAVLERLEERKLGREAAIARDSVAALRVLGADGDLTGTVVKTHWRGLEPAITIWWAVDPDGSIARVLADEQWPTEEVAGAFGALAGRGLDDFEDCKTATELAAAEVLTVCSELMRAP